MRTFMRLKNQYYGRLPDQFRDQEVRFAPELVTLFVRRYSQPGDRVFDPFAGFGTTLLVAEQMERLPFGIEYEASRVAHVRSLLRDPGAIIQGDSRRLHAYAVPPFALSMTSPPFTEFGDPQDALTNYTEPSQGYEAYLCEIQRIYAQIRERLLPGGHAVLEVSNLKGAAGVTPLAWDVARSIGQELRFEGEVIIGWDSYAYGYDHSYCLIFQRPE